MYKRKLTHFDFSKVNQVFELDTKDELKAGLKIVRTDFSWLMPQIMAFLANSIKLVRNEEGKISFTNTLRNLGSDIGTLEYEGDQVSSSMLKGIFNILTHSPRGDIYHSNVRQNSKEGLRWSSAVPLFCSAFKEYRNVPYSEWDWKDENKYRVLDKDFCDYSDYFNVELPFTVDDYLTFRESALTVKSGSNMGSHRKPESVGTIYSTGNAEFDKLPRLLKLSLIQLWIFMPQFRHELMVTNILDLDKAPKPIVEADPFKTISLKSSSKSNEQMPWDV